jgi:peroxin-10
MNKANQFDVIRSYQKDQYYLNKQNTAIRNIFNYFLNSTNRDFNDEIDLITDLLYYSLTTFLNRQTIGQESYNLILYNELIKNVPSLSNRIIHLLSRSLVPYLFNKLINIKLSNTSLNIKSYLLFAKMIIFFLKEIYKIKYFFDNNNFYDIENKVSNIKLLTINTNQNINLNKYKLLGILKSATLIIYIGNQIKMLISYISKLKQNNSINLLSDQTNISENLSKNDDVNLSNSNKSNLKCSICLENVIGPTLTSCGHIFCWLCIQRYVNSFKVSSNNTNQIACPSCRINFNQNKLVYLHNYI